MVAGKAEEGLGGGAEEFVGEAEEAVADEVEVEVLVRKEVEAAEIEEGKKGEEVERDFDRDGGPVVEGTEFAGDAATAAMVQAAKAADDEGEGDDSGEAVSGGFVIAEDFLGEFDPDEAAEQRSGDGLAGEPVEKTLV